VEHAGDVVPVEATSVEDDQAVEVVVALVVVRVEQVDELGVEGDVAVVVELPDGDSEPVTARHWDHRVCGKGAELTDPEAGPGEHFDH
jgi:hypothetical protein